MSQPLLSRLDLWSKHERRVLEVLAEALSLLRAEPRSGRSEVALNRDLYFCLLRANHNQWQAGTGGFDHPPVNEGKNPPDSDDERRAVRENKIPDFQWGFIDHAAPDPLRGAHYFVIECKRLGNSARSDWVLNENYVHHGVLRFVHPEHGYAMNEPSAAMVGYVESMELEDILTDVNAAASAAAVSEITLHGDGWRADAVSQLNHHVTRLHPQPELRLTHLWVDLRASFVPSPSGPGAE